jgi:hypothetical protein
MHPLGFKLSLAAEIEEAMKLQRDDNPETWQTMIAN